MTFDHLPFGITKRQAQAFVLVQWDRMTLREAAVIMGIANPRVHQLVMAVRKKLLKAGIEFYRAERPKAQMWSRPNGFLDNLSGKDIRAQW